MCSDWKSETADMSRHVEFSLQTGQPRCESESVRRSVIQEDFNSPAAAEAPAHWRDPAEVDQAPGKDAFQRGQTLSDPGYAGEITVYL